MKKYCELKYGEGGKFKFPNLNVCPSLIHAQTGRALTTYISITIKSTLLKQSPKDLHTIRLQPIKFSEQSTGRNEHDLFFNKESFIWFSPYRDNQEFFCAVIPFSCFQMFMFIA